MFGNNAKDTTTTTRVELSPEQRQLLNLGMPHLTQYANNPPAPRTGSGVAGFDPLQTQGQQKVLDAASGQQTLADSAGGANNFLLTDALFPQTNPALQQTIDAAVRPINEQLTEVALPAIRSQATGVGQVGGSRQGIAEGMAIREAQRAAGDTAAGIATEGYGQGLDAMIRGLGLAPTTQQTLTTPGTTVSGVGDVRQSLAQAELIDSLTRDAYNENLPLMIGQELAGLAGAIPGGATTVTQPTGSTNPITSGLGGLSLASALFPGSAGAAAAGTGLGALLAFL